MSGPDEEKLNKLWELVEVNYLAMDAESIRNSFARHLEYTQAKTRRTCTDFDCYKSASYAIRDRLMERWNDTQMSYYKEKAKRVYYLSMEFLLGRLLGNMLINLGCELDFEEAMQSFGYDVDGLREHEQDSGLGNGGLGRLAACFLDSMATLQLPGYGYGLRYDYGIFSQRIKDGYQVEKPDHWLRYGTPWEIVRPEYRYTIKFNGWVRCERDDSEKSVFSWVDADKVVALAYDVPVPGFRNNTVNTLRLWSARTFEEFDFVEFNRGDYIKAVEDSILSETITRVLYPKDDIPPGKELRLKQEYFFVSATIQDILRRFKVDHDDLSALPDAVAIQLNDTHPALGIPELMRILLDEEGVSWEQAWDICVRTFAYTNHTMLPEALEIWPIDLFGRLLPRHLQIIFEINHRFLSHVRNESPCDSERLSALSIIQERPFKAVRMANLAIVGSHSVNGVAELHTKLIKESLFKHFNQLWPERFNNKTNGITQRRWLRLANPRLSRLIDERIGDGWTVDLEQLRVLTQHVDDEEFRDSVLAAKQANKTQFSAFIEREMGVVVDPQSIFDCHIKRIHEYKRQLLNVLHIVSLYNQLKADPAADILPRTFIFAGKAAPGYYMAKLIVKLINSVAQVVNHDPDIGTRLRVIFLPNYSVTLAQRIIPAADVSEQLSTAGYEASGTGNMKFALNGALTVGTLDGANIEIREEVGEDNIFIFGLRSNEVVDLRNRGYEPMDMVTQSETLALVLEQIQFGRFCPSVRNLFQPIIDSLVKYGDHYMVLKDFDAYAECQRQVDQVYRDRGLWGRMAIHNIARVGKFSSDRTIREYAEEIWHAHPVASIMKKDRKFLKG